MTDTSVQRNGPHVRWSLMLLALAMIAHAIPFFRYHSGDADFYLIPWYQHILSSGRIQVFSQPFSNYTPSYLYLLSVASLLNPWVDALFVTKLVAILGAAWIAFGTGRLLHVLHSRLAVEGAIGSLLLPTIILNVSLLGQADTFWVAPCVLGLVAAIEGRMLRLALWSGVALSFKLQAAFFAPFVLLLFIRERPPWWYWLVPFAVYIAFMIPAWSIGWPAADLVTVYLRQVQWQPEHGSIFISNAASWWTIYGAFFSKIAIKTFWIGYAMACIAVVGYLRTLHHRELSPTTMLAAAALTAAGLPFLLPGMHERFTLLADVLTYCLAFAVPTRRTIAIAGLMQIASALPGFGWAFQKGALAWPACFFALAAIVLLVDYVSSGEAPELSGGLERDPTAET